MPKSRTTWSLLIGVALLVALLVIGVVPRLRQSAELVAAATAPAAGLVPVSVVPPRRADGPIDLVLPSNIQAIEETAIYARTSGYVRERYVDIGERVAAGKVLAQIDTPELDQELSQARAALAQTRSGLAQAQASFTQAQATLQQARASVDQSTANEGFASATAERFSRLERDELVAHQDADEKRAALAAARAATAATQANVDAMQANVGALEASVGAARANVAANEANVQRLMALQSFQKLEAPFAGIITARGIDRGALITSGSGTGASPLFRIARVENLRVFVNVPQTFVRSIVPGQEAGILVPEYPQRPFVGKIASTAGALDPTSRTLLTEVRLRNADGALMPGMYAQVKFSLVPADALWVVPATTLIARAAGSQVITVGGDGIVHYLGVQLGRDFGQSVEIISGLTGKERLVVSPPDGLKDGDRVAAEESTSR
ncbi:MAG: efflux RND transporter periplasmic adaptor subunit [Candidatus Rokuibacteriota bacterium]|nr:MAG: efflux RND transporter periplasmic adaptor subunit [Candidatus Rokubacteria bacterium]